MTARRLALGFLAAAAALILLLSALGGAATAAGFTILAAGCRFALMAPGVLPGVVTMAASFLVLLLWSALAPAPRLDTDVELMMDL